MELIRDVLYKEFEKGLNASEAVKLHPGFNVGTAHYYFRMWRKSNGIPVKHKEWHPRRDMAFELYDKGMKVIQVAEKMGISYGGASDYQTQWRKANGLFVEHQSTKIQLPSPQPTRRQRWERSRQSSGVTFDCYTRRDTIWRC